MRRIYVYIHTFTHIHIYMYMDTIILPRITCSVCVMRAKQAGPNIIKNKITKREYRSTQSIWNLMLYNGTYRTGKWFNWKQWWSLSVGCNKTALLAKLKSCSRLVGSDLILKHTVKPVSNTDYLFISFNTELYLGSWPFF